MITIRVNAATQWVGVETGEEEYIQRIIITAYID